MTLIPTLRVEFVGNDPIESTIRSEYDGVAVLPDMVDEVIPIDTELCYGGCTFVATGSGVLGYYRKLGLVELEQESVVYSGEEGMARLLDHYMSARLHSRYTVSVLRDIPEHLLL